MGHVCSLGKELRNVGLLGEMARAGDGGREFPQFHNLKESNSLSQGLTKRERPVPVLEFYLHCRTVSACFYFKCCLLSAPSRGFR